MFGLAEITASLILLIGAVDDLRSRKVHNWLVLSLLGLAAALQLYVGGWMGLAMGALGAGAAFLACLPLVLARVIGAGDLKLMVAFGMATTWTTSVSVVLWSLVWGAVLGVIRSIVAGDFTRLLAATYAVATSKERPAEASLHRIPYTIALIFGWLTVLSLSRLPGGWL